MKQITEPAPDIRRTRPDVPEDLALAGGTLPREGSREPLAHRRRTASRAGEPDGDRLPPDRHLVARRRRARQHRRPAALDLGRPPAARGQSAQPDRWRWQRADPRTGRTCPRRAGRAPPTAATSGARRGRSGTRRAERSDPGHGRARRSCRRCAPSSPTWLAVNGGLFLMNVATTQLVPAVVPLPGGGMGIGLLSNYSKLWQAGYSWRDVLRRPAAPDSIESSRDSGKGMLPKVRPGAARSASSGAVPPHPAGARRSRRRSSSWSSACRLGAGSAHGHQRDRGWPLQARARPRPDAAHDGWRDGGGWHEPDRRAHRCAQGPAGRRGTRPAPLYCWNGSRARWHSWSRGSRRWRVISIRACSDAEPATSSSAQAPSSSNASEAMETSPRPPRRRAASRNVDNAIAAAGEVKEAMER